MKDRYRWRRDLLRRQSTTNAYYFLIACGDCGRAHRGGLTAKRCSTCRRERADHLKCGTGAAHQKVANAIRRGELKPPATYLCVDCSAPAVVYDHRDYSRPLDVKPVCLSCNKRRGMAARIEWQSSERLQ